MIEQRSSRPAVGEMINVDSLGYCEVISTSDPSVIVLKRPNGETLKVGDKALAVMLYGDGSVALREQEQGHE